MITSCDIHFNNYRFVAERLEFVSTLTNEDRARVHNIGANRSDFAAFRDCVNLFTAVAVVYSRRTAIAAEAHGLAHASEGAIAVVRV